MLCKNRKRLQRLQTDQLTQSSSSEQCLVCMSMQSYAYPRGILNCSHQSFCFQCILDWSNITNRCPLCKERFYEVKNSMTHEIIKVVDKDQRVNEEGEIVFDIRCTVCGSDLDDDIMLLCDNCDQGFHTTCLGMNGIPNVREWFCDLCVWTLNDYQKKKLYEAMKKVGRVYEDDVEVVENERKKRRRLKKFNETLDPKKYK